MSTLEHDFSSDDEQAVAQIPTNTPAINGTSMVTIQDPNGSRQVTVTLATHHIMTSAASYSYKSVDFNTPASVVAHTKKVREFLKAQEAIVGQDPLQAVVKPFLKSILRGTVYKPAFSFLWEDCKSSWSNFLDLLVQEVGQLASNEHLQLALDLINFAPPAKANLRNSILHFAGLIKTLGNKQFGYVPHQAILSNKLLQFVPVSYQHYMDTELRDPSGLLSLEEYTRKLRDFAHLIHPRVMPSMSATTASAPSSAASNNRQSNSSGQRNGGSNHKNSNSNRRGNGGTNANDSANSPTHANSGTPTATGNKQQNAVPSNANNTTRFGHRAGPFSHTRPAPINIMPPITRPSVPQPASGDVSMNGNTKSAPSTAGPNANGGAAPVQLGRLVKLTEEQDQYKIWARVDSGADAHIAGKDVLGHGVPDGRHESLFAVPLQRKALVADCVRVDAEAEDGTLFKFRAVISPSTSTCLRPSSLSYDAMNPDPEQDFAVVEGIKMPVHVRDGSPYVLISLLPGKSKSKKDFCSMMGFSDDPLPSDADLARMLHVKFACAGLHSIDLTCRILGYPIAFDTIRNAVSTCLRCPSSSTFSQVRTVTSEVYALESVSPAKDVLVFDGAEFPVISERGNRSFLVAKLIRCGRYFVRPGGRSTMSDTLIKIIRALNIPVVACYSDRSADFSRVTKYCENNNISYNPSHLGREEYKGHQESAVAHAKLVMEWFLHNWDLENPEQCWEMCAYAAEHVLNTRASPSRYLIPFHVCHAARPRYDLFPLSVVTLVRDSKLLRPERTEQVVFLCQHDAQTCLVWRFVERRSEIALVHISSIRSAKFNSNNIDSFLKPIVGLNALSRSARPIRPHEKRT